MFNEVLNNISFSNNIKEIEVENNIIADSYKTGQFILIMVDKYSERIPLTISNINKKKKVFFLL